MYIGTMENINLFILRLILAAVLLNVVAAKKAKETKIVHINEEASDVTSHKHRNDFFLNPTLKHRIDENKLPESKRNKGGKKSKKAKREAYRRYDKWSSRSNSGHGENGDYTGNLPLYLVYNRKIGAYYPFYKYPKESLKRRSSNYRRVPLE